MLFAILALPFINDMSLVARNDFQGGYLDFRIFYAAALEFDRDPTGNIYATRPSYLYPPFFLTLFAWLVHIPKHAALAIFQICKWIAMYACLRMAWRMCAPKDEDVPPIVALGSLFLMWRYFTNEMLNGNINMLILCAVLGAATLALRGRLLAAGFVVAVAACTKVTPALLLLYFVYKGWWRTLIGAAAGAAVCLVIWPGAVIGWAENLRLLGEWYDHIIAGYVKDGSVYSVGTNQSLAALLNRVFGQAITMEPEGYITVLHPPAAVVTVVRVGLSLAVFAALARACRGLARATNPRIVMALEIGLVQITMLLLSGYTWKSHYVAMLLPYTALLAYLADARYVDGARTWVKRLLILSFVLMTLSSDIVTPAGADTMLAFGVVLFSGVAAAAALWHIRATLRVTKPGSCGRLG